MRVLLNGHKLGINNSISKWIEWGRWENERKLRCELRYVGGKINKINLTDKVETQTHTLAHIWSSSWLNSDGLILTMLPPKYNFNFLSHAHILSAFQFPFIFDIFFSFVFLYLLAFDWWSFLYLWGFDWQSHWLCRWNFMLMVLSPSHLQIVINSQSICSPLCDKPDPEALPVFRVRRGHRSTPGNETATFTT